MNNIELINRDLGILAPDEILNEDVLDTTKQLDSIRFSKNSLFVTMATGTLMIAGQASASIIDLNNNYSNIDNIDWFFNEYKPNVECLLTDYLIEVKKITNKEVYNKSTLIREILSFKSLKENWDGYSSLPLEVESAANAILLLDLLGIENSSLITEVYPNPTGTITFEWKNDSDEEIVVEIGNKNMSYYIQFSSKQGVYKNNVLINIEEADEISKYIKML
jgi:hypothetical protein